MVKINRRKITTVKVHKDAVLKKSKHVYRHDEIVCRTIRQMRRLKMTMIYYNECDGNYETIMKFVTKE